MFKFGISLLFVVFAELIFYVTAMQIFIGSASVVIVFTFLIQFTIAGILITKGYDEEFKKK